VVIIAFVVIMDLIKVWLSSTTKATNTQGKSFFQKQYLTCSNFGIYTSMMPVFQFLCWVNKKSVQNTLERSPRQNTLIKTKQNGPIFTLLLSA